MKPWSSEDFEILAEMPPTRGHDLKHFLEVEKGRRERMPPTRGHDLKLLGIRTRSWIWDAPHTGARLETFLGQTIRFPQLMPPTRGHDLKPQ